MPPDYSRKKIRFIIATRESQDDFFTNTATGKSIPIRALPSVELKLFPKNIVGLPQIYNIAIEESKTNPAVLVFMHDDIHLLDFYWFERLFEALSQFDVVGLAGNKRRVAKQPSWAFVDQKFTWDEKKNLSGIVGHGNAFPPQNLSLFGPAPQEVKLLDGLFLAVDSQKLIDLQIRFDELFDFHFYDMDFCRQVERSGLRMGTMQLSVIHESGGAFGTKSWNDGYSKYLEKWKD